MSLKVVIWNVEHGNAISILTPNRKRILKDLGANASTQFSPVSYQKRFGKFKVDALIISHPHRDHIDDIPSFFEHELYKELRHFVRPMRIERSSFIDNILKRNSNIQDHDRYKYEKYFDLHEKHPNTYITKNSPLHPDNNGGVRFEFFKPNKSSLDNANNHSIVTIITYEEKRIMLTGDNEKESWSELLANPKFRESIKGVDIFLASHHGRPNGYHEPLFDHFKPKLVIISDSDNKHPDAVRNYYRQIAEPFRITFDNNRKKRRKLLSTNKDNAIILTFKAGNEIHVKTRLSRAVENQVQS